jgi:type IV pilus assembly protein PilM
MATPKFAWGIDIGNRALKAVRLVSTAEGLVIDDFDAVEHETVLSAAGDNRDSLVQTALAAFVSRHPGIEKGQVGVSVNGQRTFAKFIKLPPVEPRKIPEIVKFEAIQQIPFPLDDVEWAYHLFQDPESPDVEVGIFAMRKELVNTHIGFFTDAKLNVQVVQMSPLSVYNAMYYDSRIKGTTMIVDLGAESTDLIIAEGEGVWLRSIPIGGNNFTEALTKSFKVDFDKAEELKRNSRTSKYSRQIVQAMRPIFADLVSEIQRSMGFYGSSHKDSRIERVIALGNTFRLPGLQRYLQQNLTVEVKELDRLGTSTIEDPNQAALLNENLLSSAGAYGLALQVMGQGKIGSSLLPEHIRQAKIWREKNKWFATAAALFVCGAGVAYGSYYVSAQQMASPDNLDLRQKITQVQQDGTRLSNEWDLVQAAGAGDLQRVRNVQALGEHRGIWPQINSVLYESLPQFAPGAPADIGKGDLAALKKVPRGERQQVVLSAVTSKYVSDLTPWIPSSTDLSGAVDRQIDILPTATGGMDISGNLPATGTPTVANAPRGFLLTLKCSTPNRTGAAMFVKYLSDLTAAEPTGERPIKVVNSAPIHVGLVKDDRSRMDELVRIWKDKETLRKAAEIPVDPSAVGPGARGGMPDMDQPPSALGGNGGNGGNEIPDEAYQDPTLGEDLRNDTEAVIVLVVQIDVPIAAAAPAPGAPAPATPGGPQGPGGPPAMPPRVAAATP